MAKRSGTGSGEHALGCRRQEGGAEEWTDSIADQVADDWDRRKREQWHIGAQCRMVIAGQKDKTARRIRIVQCQRQGDEMPQE